MQQENDKKPAADAGPVDLVLGPLLDGWANVECVRFVNRSTGQRTTETVSRDGLLDLMRAVQAAERDRCAKLCEQQVEGYTAYEMLDSDVAWEAGSKGEIEMARQCAAAIRGPNVAIKRGPTA